MQPLFMVGAKLLGIYLIINGLIEAVVLANPSIAGPFVAQIAASCFVSLMAGTALAFFTRFVAKVLGVPEQPADQLPTLSYQSALEVGIVLLGLLQLALVLPRLVMHFADYYQQIWRMRNPFDLLSLQTVGAAAALAMVFFAHRIAAFLERVNRHSSGP
jgi:sterol desaturase/sphingolipid hydroxylase (fatty acid hydroxylase superfamily)